MDVNQSLLGIKSSFNLNKGLFGDKSNDYISAPASLVNYVVPEEFTLEIFFKPPDTIVANEGIFCSRDTNSTNSLFFFTYTLFAGTVYDVRVSLYTDAGAIILSAYGFHFNFPGTGAKDPSLLHFRCRKSGSNYIYGLFRNGVLDQEQSRTTRVNTIPLFCFLTDRKVAGRYGGTTIYNARWYESALSDTNIFNIYNYGRGSKRPVTALFDLPFDTSYDDGGIIKTADVSGNDNHFILNNFTSPSSSFSNWSLNPDAQLLVFDGNSLTAASTYRDKVIVGLNNANYSQISFAVSGQTTQDMITDAATTVYVSLDKSKKKNILFVWEITNHLYSGSTAANAFQKLKDYCLGAMNAGFTEVVILTCLPRSNAGTPGTFEADRTSVNNLLRSDFNVATANSRIFKKAIGTNYGTYLVDVAANSVIGDAGDEANTTNYSDLIHLTAAGDQYIADDVVACINIIG